VGDGLCVEAQVVYGLVVLLAMAAAGKPVAVGQAFEVVVAPLRALAIRLFYWRCRARLTINGRNKLLSETGDSDF
jgi:hypothetical protein